MTKPRHQNLYRHEPKTVEVTKRRPITQRNLVAPPPRPDDDADTFGNAVVLDRVERAFEESHSRLAKESTIVTTPKRDRSPRGVSDGRGKRSVAEVLMTKPTPEERAVYAMERIASFEDQIGKVIDLCDPETKEIIFKRRQSLRDRYGDD